MTFDFRPIAARIHIEAPANDLRAQGRRVRRSAIRIREEPEHVAIHDGQIKVDLAPFVEAVDHVPRHPIRRTEIADVARLAVARNHDVHLVDLRSPTGTRCRPGAAASRSIEMRNHRQQHDVALAHAAVVDHRRLVVRALEPHLANLPPQLVECVVRDVARGLAFRGIRVADEIAGRRIDLRMRREGRRLHVPVPVPELLRLERVRIHRVRRRRLPSSRAAGRRARRRSCWRPCVRGPSRVGSSVNGLR